MEPLPDAIKAFLAAARVCRIATVRADGQPHLIPVCPVYNGDQILYVDIGSRSASAEGVGGNGLVAVLVDEYDEDWSRLKGLLLRCRAQALEGEAVEAAWRQIREKYPQYGSVGWEPRLTLALSIQEWRQWGILERPEYDPR